MSDREARQRGLDHLVDENDRRVRVTHDLMRKIETALFSVAIPECVEPLSWCKAGRLFNPESLVKECSSMLWRSDPWLVQSCNLAIWDCALQSGQVYELVPLIRARLHKILDYLGRSVDRRLAESGEARLHHKQREREHRIQKEKEAKEEARKKAAREAQKKHRDRGGLVIDEWSCFDKRGDYRIIGSTNRRHSTLDEIETPGAWFTEGDMLLDPIMENEEI